MKKNLFCVLVLLVSVISVFNLHLSNQRNNLQYDLRLDDLEAEGINITEAFIEYLILKGIDSKTQGTFWCYSDHFSSEIHTISGYEYLIVYQDADCKPSNDHVVRCSLGNHMKIERSRRRI